MVSVRLVDRGVLHWVISQRGWIVRKVSVPPRQSGFLSDTAGFGITSRKSILENSQPVDCPIAVLLIAESFTLKRHDRPYCELVRNLSQVWNLGGSRARTEP
jgi:hypothetical protein